MKRKFLVLVLACLAGCSSTESADLSEAVKTVSVRKGIAHFVLLCFGSAPSFGEMPQKATELGYRPNAATGAHGHPDLGTSVKVTRGSAARTCSFSFVTDEPASVYKAHMREPFKAVLTTLPGGGKAYVSGIRQGGLFVGSTGIKIGNVTQYELVMQQPL